MHLFKRYAFCLPGRGVSDVHQCLYIKSCTWISSVVLSLLLHCFHLIFQYYYTLAIALSLFSWQLSFCNFRKESFLKNSHSGENCPTHTVCHSNGHAFIWFCQKLQYRCRFFFSPAKLFSITASVSVTSQKPRGEMIPGKKCLKLISLYTNRCCNDVFSILSLCSVSSSFHARSEKATE